MADPAELGALLRIRAVPGIGDARLTALLRRHGSAVEAWSAIRAERPDAAARVAARTVEARIGHALKSLLAEPGIVAIAASDATYPAALLDLPDPPPLLFVRGDAALLETTGVAIVGTRACTGYGGDAARSIAADLSLEGITVVSGLAHGVDRHAHEATLEAGGGTIAVIGCGIDVVYPHQHERLHERIAAHGLLVSEFMPGQPALPHHFPRRNRIIAALSEAVVVVEAPARSGALITADHALDLGREVFAVPGPIGRRTSEGTNRLIRDGATVVVSSADVVEWLRSRPFHPGRTRRADAGGSGPATAIARAGSAKVGRRGGAGADRVRGAGNRASAPAAVVEAVLTDEPRHIDDLARDCGLEPARTLAALLELELAGVAALSAGSRYRRSRTARNRPTHPV